MGFSPIYVKSNLEEKFPGVRQFCVHNKTYFRITSFMKMVLSICKLCYLKGLRGDLMWSQTQIQTELSQTINYLQSCLWELDVFAQKIAQMSPTL